MYLASDIHSNIFSYLQPDELMRSALACTTFLIETQNFIDLTQDKKKSSLIMACEKSYKIQMLYKNANIYIRTKTPVCAITTGREHVVICSQGLIYAKGSNNDFQLGLKKREYHSNFTLVNTPQKVKKCTAGLWHTLFLFIDDSLASCGKNKFNQLGRAKESIREAFQVHEGKKYKDIAACENFSIFLNHNATVDGYGKSKAHCVERTAKSKRDSRQEIHRNLKGLRNVEAIKVNKQCVLVQANNKIYGWGKLSSESKKITRFARLLDTIES